MFRNTVLIVLLSLFIVIIMLVVIAYIGSIFVDFFSKDAPYVASFARQLSVLKKELNLDKNKTLVDLGCGDGKALRFFSKNFKLKKLDGYEIKHLPYIIGKILNFFHHKKKISIFLKSFFEADLKKYDYIYLYLLPNQVARIEDRIFSNIKKETIIISNSFRFSKKKPYKILKDHKGKEQIFLYKKD